MIHPRLFYHGLPGAPRPDRPQTPERMSDALHLLDDPGFTTRRDPHGMHALAVGFPAQLRDALRIAEATPAPAVRARPRLLVVAGMGGSAAGGEFVRALAEAEGTIPVITCRDYALPAYVGAEAIVFCASHSGSTEETLAAYDDARRRGATIVAVTSGGELAGRAARDGVPCVTIPAGQPPRTALGFMLVPVLVQASRLGLLAPQDVAGAAEQCERALAAWRAEAPVAANAAKRLAAALHGAVGMLYGLGTWQGVVANRWRGQLNENAKALVGTHVLPEMNHGEIVGWEGAGRQGVRRWVSILLEDGAERARIRLRAHATAGLIGAACEVHHARATGPTLLARMLSLALMGDFVSLHLAALNGVDPYAIASIDRIKQALADAR